MFFLPLLMFHAHFVMGVPWSPKAELMVFALYFVWMPTWDFLWFVLNPHFSLRDFGPAKVWWHKKWTGRIPTDYFFAWICTFVDLSCLYINE